MASRALNIRITQSQQSTAPSPAVSVPPKVTRPLLCVKTQLSDTRKTSISEISLQSPHSNTPKSYLCLII